MKGGSWEPMNVRRWIKDPAVEFRSYRRPLLPSSAKDEVLIRTQLRKSVVVGHQPGNQMNARVAKFRFLPGRRGSVKLLCSGGAFLPTGKLTQTRGSLVLAFRFGRSLHLHRFPIHSEAFFWTLGPIPYALVCFLKNTLLRHRLPGRVLGSDAAWKARLFLQIQTQCLKDLPRQHCNKSEEAVRY